MTLGQQLEVVQSLACFPALSLAVVLRRDIGYRALNPVGLAAVAAVMFLIPSMTNPENRPQDLQVFAGLVLALGLFQRFLRWQEFSRGVPQHSRYIGTSCFDAAFMPEFFRHERRLARFLDPLFCAVVGFALLHVSPALGAWIIFSALCLRLTEFAVYRLELNQKLDMVDGMSFAEVQAGTVEHFAEPPARESRPRQSAQGIPTGLGDDIERKINRSKSRQAPAQVPARKAGIAAALLKPKLTRGQRRSRFLDRRHRRRTLFRGSLFRGLGVRHLTWVADCAAVCLHEQRRGVCRGFCRDGSDHLPSGFSLGASAVTLCPIHSRHSPDSDMDRVRCLRGVAAQEGTSHRRAGGNTRLRVHASDPTGGPVDAAGRTASPGLNYRRGVSKQTPRDSGGTLTAHHETRKHRSMGSRRPCVRRGLVCLVQAEARSEMGNRTATRFAACSAGGRDGGFKQPGDGGGRPRSNSVSNRRAVPQREAHRPKSVDGGQRHAGAD